MKLFSHNPGRIPIILAIILLFLANCASQPSHNGIGENLGKNVFPVISAGLYVDNMADNLDRIIRTVKWDLDKTALRFLAKNDLVYGEKQFNARRYKTAQYYLNKGLIVYPENREALKFLAWSQFFQKRYDLALESFKKIRGFYPKDPNAAIGLAWSYFAIRKYQNALDTFLMAKRLKGNPFEVSRGRGFCWLALMDNENARNEFSKIFTPKEILAIFNLWKNWTSLHTLPTGEPLPIIPIETKVHSILQLPIEYPRYSGALMAQTILKLSPKLEKAWKIYERGNFLKALRHFEALRHTNYPDGANGLAWTLLRQDRFLDAEAIFRDIIETHPGFPGAILGLEEAERLKQEKAIYGMYYHDLKKYNIAQNHYDQLAARYPGWAFPHVQMGFIALDRENYDEARRNLEIALEIDPNNIKATKGMKIVYQRKVPLLHKGNIALKEKNFKAASQHYMDFLENPQKDFITPNITAEAYNGMGWSYYGKKQYKLAIKKFLKALPNPKYQYEASKGLGRVFYKLEDYKNAAKYFAIAEERAPKEKDIAYKLDWSILQSSSISQSEKIFRKILEKHPLRASSYMALGWIYYNKEKPDLAAEYFLRAISLDPDFALTERFSKTLDGERFGWQIYNRFGWEYFKRQRYDKSIHLFQTALGRNSKSSEAHKGIGYNFFKKGQFNKAVLFLKKALTLNSNANPVEEWVKGKNAIAAFPIKTDVHTQLGWSYYQLELYSKARSEFSKAIKIHPEWSTVYDGLGWVDLRTNRLRSARSRFQQAIQRQPLNNSAHRGLRKVKEMETEGRFHPKTAEMRPSTYQKSNLSKENKT